MKAEHAGSDRANGNGNGSGGARSIAVLWPSFLVAVLAEFAIFALVDPAAVHLPGDEPLSRPATYTIVFFALWALAAVSSALTLYFAGGPVPAPGRPTRIP